MVFDALPEGVEQSGDGGVQVVPVDERVTDVGFGLVGQPPAGRFEQLFSGVEAVS